VSLPGARRCRHRGRCRRRRRPAGSRSRTAPRRPVGRTKDNCPRRLPTASRGRKGSRSRSSGQPPARRQVRPTARLLAPGRAPGAQVRLRGSRPATRTAPGVPRTASACSPRPPAERSARRHSLPPIEARPPLRVRRHGGEIAGGGGLAGVRYAHPVRSAGLPAGASSRRRTR